MVPQHAYTPLPFGERGNTEVYTRARCAAFRRHSHCRPACACFVLSLLTGTVFAGDCLVTTLQLFPSLPPAPVQPFVPDDNAGGATVVNDILPGQVA